MLLERDSMLPLKKHNNFLQVFMMRTLWCWESICRMNFLQNTRSSLRNWENIWHWLPKWVEEVMLMTLKSRNWLKRIGFSFKDEIKPSETGEISSLNKNLTILHSLYVLFSLFISSTFCFLLLIVLLISLSRRCQSFLQLNTSFHLLLSCVLLWSFRSLLRWSTYPLKYTQNFCSDFINWSQRFLVTITHKNFSRKSKHFFLQMTISDKILLIMRNLQRFWLANYPVSSYAFEISFSKIHININLSFSFVIKGTEYIFNTLSHKLVIECCIYLSCSLLMNTVAKQMRIWFLIQLPSAFATTSLSIWSLIFTTNNMKTHWVSQKHFSNELVIFWRKRCSLWKRIL